MTELPQGRKSLVEVMPDGNTVRKTYNSNGDPATKYRRELGFYLNYAGSGLIPKLRDFEQNRHILIERVTGQRLADILPLSIERVEALAEDYVEQLLRMFDHGSSLSDQFKEYYYDGCGAQDNLEALIEDLGRLSIKYPGNPLIANLSSSLEGIEISEEILIKLDWNAENLFLSEGRIHKIVDFEQAFIGTKSILVGVLLHNPIWPAARLFSILKNAGWFKSDVKNLKSYLSYGFAAVLVDSIQRTGKLWSPERLRSAFDKHLVRRLAQATDSS